MDVRIVLQVWPQVWSTATKPISAPRWQGSAAIVFNASAAALNRIAYTAALFCKATPSGEARNVGQMYALFARAIRDGDGGQPTFETAVDLHRLVDTIRQASDDGREVTIE
jgi:predicted dehydrogenase